MIIPSEMIARIELYIKKAGKSRVLVYDTFYEKMYELYKNRDISIFYITVYGMHCYKMAFAHAKAKIDKEYAKKFKDNGYSIYIVDEFPN